LKPVKGAPVLFLKGLTMITVILRGDPQGKGRPRSRIMATGRKQFIQVYTPAETRAYEKALGLAGRVAMGRRSPLEGPLEVTVVAIMRVPSSWSIKKRDAALAGALWPTGTPDWDNLAKVVDGLNGVVWLDDKQIVCGRVEKRYGEHPMLKIEVKPVEHLLGQSALQSVA
jgi:Holliday junction resolvase RusA-like endonuclease